ncbi:hypothetical protein L596_020518 [Steinernema carpocapsae]|uniref:G-protein coupled receptors family 1 profile domain-containing protein n=1 Tax=Steinernema carpocapsae TaxID=34508 RepID=A0A4U5MTZ8_STECR|nr:hypothetical protein L596_020518 [Steinernema carpocapsae]
MVLLLLATDWPGNGEKRSFLPSAFSIRLKASFWVEIRQMDSYPFGKLAIPFAAWNTWAAFIACIGNCVLLITIIRSNSLRSPCAIFIAVHATSEIVQVLSYYRYVATVLTSATYSRRECFWYSLPSQLAVHMTLKSILLMAMDRFLSMRFKTWYHALSKRTYTVTALCGLMCYTLLSTVLIWTGLDDSIIVCHVLNVATDTVKYVWLSFNVLNAVLIIVFFFLLKGALNKKQNFYLFIRLNKGRMLVETDGFEGTSTSMIVALRRIMLVYLIGYTTVGLILVVLIYCLKNEFVINNFISIMDTFRILCSVAPLVILYQRCGTYRQGISATLEDLSPSLFIGAPAVTCRQQRYAVVL